MDILGPWHLLIIAAIFVMMFGAKRLPDAARSLGRSARILKTELKDMRDDDPRPTPQPSPPVTNSPVTVTTVRAPQPVASPEVDLSAGPVGTANHQH